jgi:hypothetical protein
MKKLLLLGLLPFAGCGITPDAAGAVAVGVIAVGVATVATIQRSPADAVYSLFTGRDCSVVRLDQGKTYCRPVEPKPEPPPFCTRTLAAVNCWRDPDTMPGQPHGVADGPAGLTAAQEADRVRTWP